MLLAGDDIREHGELISPALHVLVAGGRIRELVPQEEEGPLLAVLQGDDDARAARPDRLRRVFVSVGEHDPLVGDDLDHLAGGEDAVRIADTEGAARPCLDRRPRAPPRGEALAVGEVAEDRLAAGTDEDGALQDVVECVMSVSFVPVAAGVVASARGGSLRARPAASAGRGRRPTCDSSQPASGPSSSLRAM